MEYIDFSKYFLQYQPIVQQLDNDELPVTKGIDFDNAYSNPAGQASPLYDYDYYKKINKENLFNDLFKDPTAPSSTSTNLQDVSTTKLPALITDISSGIPDALNKSINELIGKPYSWGGGHGSTILNNSLVKGLDCSGFARYAYYSAFGIDIGGGGASSQFKRSMTQIDKSEVKPGDFILFKNTYKCKNCKFTHIGIVYEVKNGKVTKMAHASSSKGVAIVPYDENYWNKYEPTFAKLKK